MPNSLQKLVSALTAPFKKSLKAPLEQSFSSCGALSCRRPGCIIPTAPQTPFPLTTLPIEIQLQVILHLSFWDLQALRHTNHYFHDLIPSPTHDELLAAEQGWAGYLHFHHYIHQPRVNIYACAGCLRLRPEPKFKTGLPYIWEKIDQYGVLRHCRFCIECRDEAVKDPVTEEWWIGREWNYRDKTQMDIFWCEKCERTGVKPWARTHQPEWCLRCLTVDWGDEGVQRVEEKALKLRRVKRKKHVARLRRNWEAHIIARNEAIRRWVVAGKNISDWPEEFYEDDEPVHGMKLEREEDMFAVNRPGRVDIFRYRTDFSGVEA